MRELGVAGLDLFVGARELYAVFAQTLYYAVRGRREKGAIVRQMYEIGNQSLFFVSITMGFIGMILLYQAASRSSVSSPTFPFWARRTWSSSCATSGRRSAR